MHSAANGAGELFEIHEQVAFDAILDLLSDRCDVDFRSYRLATLRRRVLNRMISARTRTFEEYLRLLRAHADEAEQLLARVTIKVSRFYRNRATFDALRGQVIPELRAARSDAVLRILSAGCGQGEEPYTLAMLLEDCEAPGSIDAIDIDPGALRVAADGRYDEAALEELPTSLRERYLRPNEDRFSICASVRRRVSFARRDITALPTQDAALGSYDLVCCRNVLIYLTREIQVRTLSTLCGYIRPGGFLCLGEAEWPMLPIAASLQALPHKTRIFRLHPGSRA